MFESLNKKYKISTYVEIIIVSAVITLAAIFQKCLRSTDDTVETVETTGTAEIAGHEYVDLGLPSGTFWATCNVGASKPSDVGAHYRWGEIDSTDKYESDSDYKWYSSDSSEREDSKYTTQNCLEREDSKYITKYCLDGNNAQGVRDNIRVLESCDDAATAAWGPEWRMPTKAEMQELVAGCSWKWTSTYKRIHTWGLVGTSKTNGNTIFLHVIKDPDLDGCYGYGYYWTSSLSDEDSEKAYNLMFYRGEVYCNSYKRTTAQSVRAVVNKK